MMNVFKKTLTALFFIALPIFAQNEWEWQNPVPQGNQILTMQALDASTVYAAGNASTFMRSTDGGNNWEVIHNIYDSNLGDFEEIHF
ncbi:MAG: hypothetical protein AAFP70_21890, partial [Calditrichota bacterium]